MGSACAGFVHIFMVKGVCVGDGSVLAKEFEEGNNNCVSDK
jgi:hypothetical protein